MVAENDLSKTIFLQAAALDNEYSAILYILGAQRILNIITLASRYFDCSSTFYVVECGRMRTEAVRRTTLYLHGHMGHLCMEHVTLLLRTRLE